MTAHSLDVQPNSHFIRSSRVVGCRARVDSGREFLTQFYQPCNSLRICLTRIGSLVVESQYPTARPSECVVHFRRSDVAAFIGGNLVSENPRINHAHARRIGSRSEFYRQNVCSRGPAGADRALTACAQLRSSSANVLSSSSVHSRPASVVNLIF